MKPTLLIVDDIQSVREHLRECLEKEFDVIGLAASGAEAIALCKAQMPQLILMDLVMPKMSGIDAAKSIMAMVNPAKIVVLSALHDENIVLRALEAGVAEYLIKPVPESKIKEALRGLSRQAA